MFLSEVSTWGNNQTGYLVSVETLPTKGSTANPYDINSNKNTRIVLAFDIGNVGLLTKRTVNSTFLLFISALIGSATGIVGIGGVIMSQLEGKSETIGSKYRTKRHLENLIKKSQELDANFNDNDLVESKLLNSRDVTDITFSKLPGVEI